jgi:hypothetical protein
MRIECWRISAARQIERRRDMTVQIGWRERAGTLAGDLRDWLTSGALQSSDGAFCAWRDVAADQLAFEYPEITGYALTFLSAGDEIDDAGLDAGLCAAEWLLRRFASGDRSARANWDGGAVYTFDLGMIASGLQSFGGRAGSRQYVDLGRATARKLVAYGRGPRGLESVAPDGPPTQRPGTWSTSGRPHLVKCVQSLLLAEETDAAYRLVQHTMALQLPDGHFATQPDGDHVMLHPHLYTIEGLWMWGTACGDDEALERARVATEWTWQHQLPSGGMPRSAAPGRVGPEQFDVTSQAIRAALLTGVQPAGLERAVARLCDQARKTDAGAGLVYQPEAPTQHLNAWVTMFAAQAMYLAATGPAAMDWSSLV